ncbi:GNAT family N-acetyltransferase [Hydrogenophaga sp. 5NK40-0174]
MNADAEVMAHFPAPLTRAESDTLVDRCAAEIEAQGWGFWAAEHADSGVFMGMVGLHAVHASLPFAPCVEVGWRLARPWWGQGLATEAASAALTWGFDALGLPEVVAFTAQSNQRSRGVMLRLGMQAAGTFEHPLLPADSRLREHVLFRLPAAAWRERAETTPHPRKA